MTRPLRVEYPGGMYHIMSRGNASQKIFLAEEDWMRFLTELTKTMTAHNIICHAYCLMDNHYHLLIETIDGNLSKAMKDLNGNYAQWFNKKWKRVGHLYQGRYKALVIEKEPYLLEVTRYIVLNPVRAQMVSDPEKWRWSSYSATIGETTVPHWLFVDWLLSNFSKNKKEAQVEFQRFVMEGINSQDPYQNAENGFVLGSPQFIHSIWEKTVGSEEMKEYPRNERIVGRPSLKEIFSDVSNKEERNDAIIFAKIRCGYLASEIAPYAKLDQSVVGKIAKGRYNLKKADSRT